MTVTVALLMWYCCAVLCCAVLCCAVLCCAVLCCAVIDAVYAAVMRISCMHDNSYVCS